MEMEQITSTGNRWVKLAVQLKMKKYREKNEMFIMEGLRSAEDAAEQGKRDAICFVAARAIDSRMSLVMEKGRELHWLFLETSDSIMEKLSGTENGQGVICLFKKEKAVLGDLSKRKGYYVLLDGVQDPGNMGTILRTSAAAGCNGVLLMEGCTDPYSEKAVRSSMGSIFRIPVYEHITYEAVKSLSAHIPLIGTALEEAVPYRALPLPSSAVFVFGNEGNGVSPSLLSLCREKIYIPMKGHVESLNVAASVAVVLFHFLEN